MKFFHNQTNGTPVEQHVPDQAAYRANIPAGKGYEADALVGTHATAFTHRYHPDGTVDMIRLDQNGSVWFEWPGQGSVDFKVGRI